MKKLAQNFCASLLIYASLNAMLNKPDLQQQRAQEHYEQIKQSGLPQDIQQYLQGYFWSATRQGHSRTITAMSLSPDGRYLATGSKDKSINISGLEEGTGFKSYPKQKKEINTLSFAQESRYLASGDESERIKIFDTHSTSLTPVTELICPHGTHSLTFSQQDNYLTSVSGNNSIQVWNLEDFTEIAKYQGQDNQLVKLGFSPDGTCLAVGFSGKISVWKVVDFINNTHLSHTPAAQPIARLDYFDHHLMELTTLSFSPDGKYLTALFHNVIHIWKTADFSTLARCRQPTHHLTALCFTPDSNYLAIGSSNKKIEVFEINQLQYSSETESAQPIATINDLNAIPSALCFVPHNSNLICACGKKVRIYSPFNSLSSQQISFLIMIFKDNPTFKSLSFDDQEILFSLPQGARPAYLQQEMINEANRQVLYFPT